MQDYEYYEARVNDIKLEDITSSVCNAKILAGLRDNNRESFWFDTVNEHCDFHVREGDHLGWVGYFIGRSNKLETLGIFDFFDFPDNINLNAFLRGVGRNRSIQTLELRADLGESFQSLVPFLRNNDSLRDLGFGGFDIGLQCARNIALLLNQQHWLKRLSFDETVIEHEGFIQIATALRSQSQIEELSLCINRVSFVALGNALEGCLNLRKLILEEDDNVNDNNIDDEGINALATGLKHCHNLTSLLLYNMMITEEGSRSLSTLFQSDTCRLERLELSEMNTGDDGMAVLVPGLASLPSLKQLTLRDNSIGDRGLQDLVRGLVNCNLEKLNLSGNELMDSVSGLRALGTLVGRTANMRSLSLCNSSLTDEGLESFVEGMANCCSLTRLNLSSTSITANGLAFLSSLFRAEHCSLSELPLHSTNMSDDGAEALANGLVGNKSLTHLRFDSSSIKARGWAAFRRLLCDTSSVNNTYLSNHTLVEVGVPANRFFLDTPADIVQYLKLNKSNNQAAAICKILHSHPDIDVTPLFGFNLMCLPLVVAWLEKAKPYLDEVNISTDVFKNRQLSVMFKIIRGMPLLAANGFRSQKEKDVQMHLEVKSKKRKHDQTLDG